ncbi:uncharacterized protein B0P05DRAFT_536436 [Gilbertella persicaria]|uniref:uncharacterized protein n=1 Tax=Gilbertella persicaria TaxID=101096 RepID=UPI0022209BDE|nr:uncharacterized protein B0P05DRAFT_536436 [Gilbertella persicaria]KAI8083190.1 hypothetical protein B0P05DRAFT_536436 [Gilbertella persicaria]
MSSEENNNNNIAEQELARLDKFVKAEPGSEYTIDQKEQELCRNFPGGQSECIRLRLEYTQMFTKMQELGFFCQLPMDPTKTYMECRRV